MTKSEQETYKCVQTDSNGCFKKYEVSHTRIRFANPPSQSRIDAGKRISQSKEMGE